MVRSVFGRLDWRTQQRLLELRARVQRRGGDPRFDYSVSAVRASAKHTSPAVPIDRLLRYQRALGHEIDFKGRIVIELGAGPVLGWALTGLALGASRYVVLDPSFNPDVIDAIPGYFRDQRRWLANIAADPGDPTQLMADGRIQVVRARGDRTGLADGSADLILSNSVIEHVLEVDDLLDELVRIAAPDCVQYHFVDFTDHRVRADRFAAIYGHHPDEIRGLYRHRGQILNLLRACDIEAAMGKRFTVEGTVLLRDDSYPSVRQPEPWWAEHYERDDLAVELAAFRLGQR